MINGIVIGLSTLAGVWLGWHALLICCLIVLIVKVLERDNQFDILLVCLAFAAIGAMRSDTPPETTSTPELELSTGAIGTITSFPIPSGDGHRAILSVSELCLLEQCIPVETQVLVYIREQNPALSRGQTLRVDWRVDTLEDLPPGYRSYVASQGAEGSAHTTRVVQLSEGPAIFQWMATANQHVTSRIGALLPGDAGALGSGIVTGDDSGLTDEAEENFRATGTSHITAVSGQNVTLIIGFLSLWYHPRTQRGRILLHTILFAVVWGFTLFVGMEAPALRAAIVASLSILGSHVGRRPDPVTLLSLTLGAIALINPLSVYSAGFWLSAAASMALCLTLPRTLVGGARGAAIEIVKAPVLASIATMPISLMTFGVWSPMGILANIILAPILTLAFPVMYFYALLASVLPSLAEYISFVPQILLEIALVIVNIIAPEAMQWRIDTFSPALMFILWTPIIVGIWLVSNESQRWIQRMGKSNAKQG